MKLATLEHGSRDGSLAAVSRDLSSAIVVETPLFRLKTLQQLVANADSTQLRATQICADQNKALIVDYGLPPPTPHACTAALPRIYPWA
jgi:hypothetical protein